MKDIIKQIKIKDILLFGLVIFVFFYFKSCGNTITPNIIKVPVKEKPIVNNITKKQETIRTFEKEVFNKEELDRALENFKISLMRDLDSVRRADDLLSAVRIQDSIINIQENQITNLRGTVDIKDSIITAQRYIINSKDTLLSIKEADVKKFKKQRNIAALIAIIEGGLLILK